MGMPSGGEWSEGLEEHIYCCSAATEVLKFGQLDLRHTSDCESSANVLFLIIPGNPGIVGYYKTFMQALYQTLDHKYPVWAVSQAGHCLPPDSMEMMEDTDIIELEDVFGLNGQIEHKLAFLKQYVPRNIKLVLIGHSIGCYIILEMMKRDPDLQVLKSVLLFPTIERMAVSPQGKLMTPVLCKLRYAMYVPVYFLSFLPESIKASMVRLVLRGLQSLDESSIPASVTLFSVDCVANAMYLGSQEMVQVMDRDNPTIKKNLDKIIFYYGSNDQWCPEQYYEDIKKDFPEGDIRLCERGIRHAFVLNASKEVASMITDWLHADLAIL
ncbi:lipid droplet-associated hydrolase [Huso huso]|uniref:Lipid droplet-associated hydrolase n=1 Tax=Huso huso TaxID=61971 RepID=A0ABR0ZUV5_HUSHU